MSQAFDKLLDARGMNCPMPLVNARKEAGKLELGQEEESVDGANVYVHYVKRIA